MDEFPIGKASVYLSPGLDLDYVNVSRAQHSAEKEKKMSLSVFKVIRLIRTPVIECDRDVHTKF